MSSSNFASFAPYTPPPDDAPHRYPTANKLPARPWFPAHTSHSADTSYQSGGLPTFNASASTGIGSTEETPRNQWETRYGMRVDVLAALAYILGPVSALALLIIETCNDFVRFHAYQSAILTTPLVVIRLFMSLLQFPSWMRTFVTILIVFSQLCMALRAYLDASLYGLARFQIPIAGSIATRWLAEE